MRTIQRAAASFTALNLLLVVMWAGGAVWASRAGMRLAGAGDFAATLAVLLLNLAFYERLRKGDRVAEMVRGFAVFTALATASGVLSYLAATLARPYADPALAAADAALGFDWLAWWHLVRSRPLLGQILQVAYNSMLPQTVIALVALPLCGMAARSRELLAAMAVAIVPTLALFALYPAMCAWFYYRAEPDRIATFLFDLTALRNGTLPLLDLRQMHGLVTFPSFHTIAAVLLANAARGTRWFLLAAVVDALMIVSTLTEGGHYLADLLAGIAIALGSIAAVRWAQRKADRAGPAARAGASPIQP